MAQKNLIFLLIFFILCSCSTGAQKKKKDLSELSEIAPPPDAVEFPPQLTAEDLGNSQTDFSPLEELKTFDVAVWIDAAGFESLQALGFLQELEKSGVSPRYLLGTGMGCWVASSWALDGNGNRAEWQAFKWNSWEHLKDRSWFSKDDRSEPSVFQKTIVKWAGKKKLNDLKLPVDCPYFDPLQPKTLRSSRDLELSLALWQQIPALIFEDEGSSDQVSGFAQQWPNLQAIDFFYKSFSSELQNSDKPLVWLFVNAGPNRYKVRPQPDSFNGAEDFYLTKVGNFERVWVVNFFSDEKPSVSFLKSPSRRRRWLLNGRSKAKKFVEAMQVLDLREPNAEGAENSVVESVDEE